MNIYLLTQTQNRGWDTYDSAVVIASDEETARKIHPATKDNNSDEDCWASSHYWGWCNKPEDVKVTLVGVALPAIQQGVVCASFNAG